MSTESRLSPHPSRARYFGPETTATRARGAGLEIAVRGGGHNVAGRAVTEGGLMIDLADMKGIHVDPVARTIRAQGGVTWAEFNRETAIHGLATPGGTV